MRTLSKTTCALALASAMALGTAASVQAQGFYLNAPGVHIGVGYPGYHRHYWAPRYYDYYPGYAGGGWETYNGCPPHYTIQGGACRPYRGW
jgi:hypothetical protein